MYLYNSRWSFYIYVFVSASTWGHDPVWLIFLKGGWNHQLENNGWAARIVIYGFIFAAWMIIFPMQRVATSWGLSTNQMVNFHLDHKPINWKTGEIRKLTLKRWWPFGLPGILNHYQEGRNCRMANKKRNVETSNTFWFHLSGISDLISLWQMMITVW